MALNRVHTLYSCWMFRIHWAFYVYTNLDEAVIKSRSTFLIVGIIMFYVGVIGSTLGLGLAGTLGGYSTTILHAPITNTEAILQPFEKPIQTFLIMTVIGVLILVYIFLAAESHEDK